MDSGVDRTPGFLSTHAAAAYEAMKLAVAQSANNQSQMGWSQMGASQMGASQAGVSRAGGTNSAISDMKDTLHLSQGASGASLSFLGSSVGVSNSAFSQASEGGSSVHGHLSVLAKKTEARLAKAEFLKQQLDEITALTPHELEANYPIVMRETPTFMILDIKSSVVRKDDEAGIQATEAKSLRYSEIKELKITAADNYGSRGVNTTNRILKTMAVQEKPIESVSHIFQASEWDIYDSFQLDGEALEGEMTLEDELKIEEKAMLGNDANSRTQEAENSVMDSKLSIAQSRQSQSLLQSQSGFESSAIQSASHLSSHMVSGSVMNSSVMDSSGQPLALQQMGNQEKLPSHLSETMRVLERMVMQNVYAANHLQYSGFDIPPELVPALQKKEEEEEEDEEDEDEDEEEFLDEEIDYRLDKLWNYECPLTAGFT